MNEEVKQKSCLTLIKVEGILMFNSLKLDRSRHLIQALVTLNVGRESHYVQFHFATQINEIVKIGNILKFYHLLILIKGKIEKC